MKERTLAAKGWEAPREKRWLGKEEVSGSAVVHLRG